MIVCLASRQGMRMSGRHCLCPKHVTLPLIIYLVVVQSSNTSTTQLSTIKQYNTTNINNVTIASNQTVWEHDTATMTCKGDRVTLSACQGSRIAVFDESATPKLDILPDALSKYNIDVTLLAVPEKGIMLILLNASCVSCNIYQCFIEDATPTPTQNDNIVQIETFLVEAKVDNDSYVLTYSVKDPKELPAKDSIESVDTYDCRVIGPDLVMWQWNVSCSSKKLNLNVTTSAASSASQGNDDGYGIITTSSKIKPAKINNQTCPRYLTSSTLNNTRNSLRGCNISCRIILDINGLQERWPWMTYNMEPLYLVDGGLLVGEIVLLGVGIGCAVCTFACTIAVLYGCATKYKARQRKKQFVEYRNTQRLHDPAITKMLSTLLTSQPEINKREISKRVRFTRRERDKLRRLARDGKDPTAKTQLARDNWRIVGAMMLHVGSPTNSSINNPNDRRIEEIPMKHVQTPLERLWAASGLSKPENAPETDSSVTPSSASRLMSMRFSNIFQSATETSPKKQSLPLSAANKKMSTLRTTDRSSDSMSDQSSSISVGAESSVDVNMFSKPLSPAVSQIFSSRRTSVASAVQGKSEFNPHVSPSAMSISTHKKSGHPSK